MHTNDINNLRMTIRKILFHILKYIGILLGMGILGISLLTFSYMQPVNDELRESSLSHSSQMGWGPNVNNRYTQYESHFADFEPGLLDDATDLIILNNALNNENTSALYRAIDMSDYGRYWHGYVAVLRPILHFMDYWDFLLSNSYLQFLLMGLVGIAIFKTTGKVRFAFTFLCSCLFLTPLATGVSLQYTPIFYISLLGTLFCVTKTNWILQKDRRYYLFLFLGILTCYFDFLTYPLLSFAFPLCWLIVSAGEKLAWQKHLHLLFGGGFSFLFGYGGFFIVKWIIQAIILKDGILANGFSQVLHHISNADEEHSLLHQCYSRFDVLYNNFRHYLTPVFILIICLWILLFAYKYLRGEVKVTPSCFVFSCVTLTSIVWYLILNTHTSYHHLFTYRIYGAALLGFMLFVCCSISESTHNKTNALSLYGKRIILLIVCLAIGLGASRIAKEDLNSVNGGENEELLLTEDDELIFEFTPSIKNIRRFSLCYHVTESLDGNILLEFIDNDNVVLNCSAPVNRFEKSVYLSEPINWNLKAGHTYLLRVTLQDNPTGIYVLRTPEGIKPQSEYGAAFLNGDQLGNIAPLSFITYRGNVQTVPIKLFIAVCAASYILMWCLAIHCALKCGNVRLLRKSDQ